MQVLKRNSGSIEQCYLIKKFSTKRLHDKLRLALKRKSNNWATLRLKNSKNVNNHVSTHHSHLKGFLPVICSSRARPTVTRHFRLSMFPRHVAVERALRRVALAAAFAQVRLHKLVLREQVVPTNGKTITLYQ